MLPAAKADWNCASVSVTSPSQGFASAPAPSTPHGLRTVTYYVPASTETLATVYAWLPTIGIPPPTLELVTAATALWLAKALLIVEKIEELLAENVVVATPRSLKAEPVQPQFSEP